MTPDEQALLTRIGADLSVAHALRNADRPDDLTASSIGLCLSYAARTLLRQPPGGEGDFWRALRGHYVHDGVTDDLVRVDPALHDGRHQRFTWHPGGGLPDITGAGDFAFTDDEVCVEMKTKSRDECRWHADHGPDVQQSMQASIAAEAQGYGRAAVLFVPIEGGWEEASLHLVDVRHWTAEARRWLGMADVRAEVEAAITSGLSRDRAAHRVLDAVPRDQPVRWCRMFCRFAKDCRGDYETPADLEVLDPDLRAATQEAEHWRQVRLDAGRREGAAKSRIGYVEGVVTLDGGEELRVAQQVVRPTEARRGHKRTTVERRAAP